MGCSNTTIKDKRIAELTHQMNLLKVEKVDVLQEKYICLKELERITGKPQKLRHIPNYISPEYEGYEIVIENISEDDKLSDDSENEYNVNELNKRIISSQSTKSSKASKRKINSSEDDE
jgi:hypothetical protein